MRIFSMFSGIAGFEMACVNRGHTIVGACEFDEPARNVYRKYFPQVTIHSDARTLDVRDVPDHDILVAGFPCQPFSGAGKRLGREDPRGEYFLEIVRIIGAKRPQHLLLENVPGLLSIRNGKTLREIVSALTNIGFCIRYDIVDAADCTAQKRRRLFFVGHLATA